MAETEEGRVFDFRPGYCAPRCVSKHEWWRHRHWRSPGCREERPVALVSRRGLELRQSGGSEKMARHMGGGLRLCCCTRQGRFRDGVSFAVVKKCGWLFGSQECMCEGFEESMQHQTCCCDRSWWSSSFSKDGFSDGEMTKGSNRY